MTILIAGDYWGAGECNIDCTKILHPGLEQYIRDSGQSVVNISKGGVSNLDIVNRISQWLERNSSFGGDPVSKILVFQTECLRDYKHDVMQKYFGVDDWNVTSVREIINVWVERFYTRLSEIAQATDCRIYLLGGASDTMWFDNMEDDYPGCSIGCQSVTNLIVHGTHRTNTPVFDWFFGKNKEVVKKLMETTDKNELWQYISLGMDKEFFLSANPKLFYPDGRHPNRHGHRILYDFLKGQQIL